MRERVINRAGIWAGLTALTAALLLAVALSPQAAAQDGSPPLPPHWFFGVEFVSDDGATVRALDQDGEQVGTTTIGSAKSGQWSLIIDPADADSVTLEISSDSSRRVTGSYTLPYGRLTEIKRSDFTVVAAPVAEPEPEAAETAGVRVRARVSDTPGREGQIEFGASLGDADPVTPRARYFPASITHNRWLRSSPIDLGGGVVVRVIARVSDNPGREGRIEFGLYVDGVDADVSQYNSGAAEPMFLPPARYFPDPYPSHNRWLRSTVVEVPVSR